MKIPPFAHCNAVPTSGDRKKFCCAATCWLAPVCPPNAPAARYPSTGACAVMASKFAWMRTGCVNASGPETVSTPPMQLPAAGVNAPGAQKDERPEFTSLGSGRKHGDGDPGVTTPFGGWPSIVA